MGNNMGENYYQTFETTIYKSDIEQIILIGCSSRIPGIQEEVKKHGFNDYVFMDTYADALKYCSDNAVSGEAVLLSPACASWDMFPSYEVRGNEFKDYVNSL